MSFLIAKLFWIIINPFNILIFLTLICILCFVLKFKFLKKLTLTFLIINFTIFFFLPTGSFLIHLLEKKFHNFSDLSDLNQVDGIIIMGGSTDPYLSDVYNQIIFKASAERLFEAKRLIEKFPRSQIIFTGGSGKILNNTYNESDDAKNFFLQNGIDTEKIIFENKSRNTYENILLSKESIDHKTNGKWLVISSAYHLTRVINVADNIGWKLIPYATDFQIQKKFKFNISFNFYKNLSQIQLASHEWIALFYYYLSGKTKKLY